VEPWASGVLVMVEDEEEEVLDVVLLEDLNAH